MTHIRPAPLCANDHICCQSLKEKKLLFYYFCWQLFIIRCKNFNGCQDSSISKHRLRWNLLPSSSNGQMENENDNYINQRYGPFIYLFIYLFVLESIKSSLHVRIHGSSLKFWGIYCQMLIKFLLCNWDIQTWGGIYNSAGVALTCASLVQFCLWTHWHHWLNIKKDGDTAFKKEAKAKVANTCLQSLGQQANCCKKTKNDW